MPEPSTRLWLFFSVDVGGSTRFKLTQPWITTFGEFLTGGQEVFEQSWKDAAKRILSECKSARRSKVPVIGSCPKIFKTLGDELVFYKEIEAGNDAEIVCCIRAFVNVIKHYQGIFLISSDGQLSVKGAAWAVEGNRNIELSLQNSNGVPSFDIVGPNMDEGFRVAKYAATKKIALSISIALLLSEAFLKYEGRANDAKPLGLEIVYGQGEVLKGLFRRDIEYPQIQIRLRNFRSSGMPTHDELIRRHDMTRHLSKVCKEWVDQHNELPFDPADPPGEPRERALLRRQIAENASYVRNSSPGGPS